MTNLENLQDRKWVWVPCQYELYKPGYIVDETATHATVQSNVLETFSLSQTARMNPSKFDLASDLALLSHLNEPGVLHNLKKRYDDGLIYTYSGLFLLSLNPYRHLLIYSEEVKNEITLKKFRDAEPHIFSVANEAYRRLLSNGGNQSILITGESGAGKTENTKRVIEFLAGNGPIEKMLHAANPVLEAFGNAKTVRNDNSSRFGKFIQLKFKNGIVQGARIEKYLLEKSRITHRNDNERTFHVFYYLLRGADAHLLSNLGLSGSPDDYLCIQNKNSYCINGIDDSKEFQNLNACFNDLGITDTLKYYRIVAAILHLGNITFREEDDKIHIVDNIPVEWACKLLNISFNDFLKEILHPTIKAGNETVIHSRSATDAYKIVEGLMKMLYNALFDNLVSEINSLLDLSACDSFIGILDIAGFEIFKTNSFEQLCINYTNEKLQQFFNHHMFILEQEIYRNECIEWSFIDFGLDLEPTIQLIESNNPIGILSYLDEECIMPGASDDTLLNKIRGIKGVERPGVGNSFRIKHYAGAVDYEVTGWLDKNKDVHSENLHRLVRATKSVLVMNEGNVKKGIFRTVSQSHRENLKRLMELLRGTNPHFVRCILPNLNKSDCEFDKALVLDQLRCNGVLEGIRITRLGYPSRIKFDEFNNRYQILGDESVKQAVISKDQSERLLRCIGINKADYKVGNTMVFMRQGILADIEDMRERKISALAKEVTGILRHKIEVRRNTINEERRKAVLILQKNARMAHDLLKWKWWGLFIRIKPLLEVQKNGESLREKEEQIRTYSDMINREREEKKRMESEILAMNNILEERKKENELNQVALGEKESLLDGLRKENRILVDGVKVLEGLKEKIRQCEIKEENHWIAMEKVEDKIKVLSEDLGLKDSLIASLTQKGGDLSSTLQKKEDEMREVQKMKNELEIEMRRMRDQIVSVNEEKIGLVDKLEQQENKVRMQESLIQKIREEMNDVEFENETLRGELRRKELICEEDSRSLALQRQELDYFKGKSQVLENSLTEEERKVKELESKVEEYSTIRSSTEETVSILQKQVKTLNIKLNNIEGINAELIREKDEMYEENQKLAREKIEALCQLDCKENQERKALQLEIQKLRGENEKLRVDIANGSSSHDEGLETILEKMSEQLENEKTGKRQCERKMNELEMKIAVQENRMRELEEEIKEKDEQRMRQESEYLRGYVPKEGIVKIKQRLEKTRGEINVVCEIFLEKFQKLLNDKEKALEESNKALEVVEEQKTRLEYEIEQLSAEKEITESLRKEIEQLVKKNSIMKSEMDGLVIEKECLAIEVGELKNHIGKILETFNTRETEICIISQEYTRKIENTILRETELKNLLDDEKLKNLISETTKPLVEQISNLKIELVKLSAHLAETQTENSILKNIIENTKNSLCTKIESIEFPVKERLISTFIIDKDILKSVERKRLISCNCGLLNKVNVIEIPRENKEKQVLLLNENNLLRIKLKQSERTVEEQGSIISGMKDYIRVLGRGKSIE